MSHTKTCNGKQTEWATHRNCTGLLYSLRNRLRSSLRDMHSLSLTSQDTPRDVTPGSGISNVHSCQEQNIPQSTKDTNSISQVFITCHGTKRAWQVMFWCQERCMVSAWCLCGICLSATLWQVFHASHYLV